MRIILQRVKYASVTIDGKINGKIDKGFMVLVGFKEGDEESYIKPMAEKMAALSGYALDVPMGLAVGGGFKDWFQKELRRPAFTVEIGKGKNPLLIDEADVIYNKIRKMMLFSATI